VRSCLHTLVVLQARHGAACARLCQPRVSRPRRTHGPSPRFRNVLLEFVRRRQTAAIDHETVGRGPGWLLSNASVSIRPDPGDPCSAASAPKRPHGQQHTAHQRYRHKDDPDRFQRWHCVTLRPSSRCKVGSCHSGPAAPSGTADLHSYRYISRTPIYPQRLSTTAERMGALRLDNCASPLSTRMKGNRSQLAAWKEGAAAKPGATYQVLITQRVHQQLRDAPPLLWPARSLALSRSFGWIPPRPDDLSPPPPWRCWLDGDLWRRWRVADLLGPPGRADRSAARPDVVWMTHRWLRIGTSPLSRGSLAAGACRLDPGPPAA
jgi:hypothetical protein